MMRATIYLARVGESVCKLVAYVSVSNVTQEPRTRSKVFIVCSQIFAPASLFLNSFSTFSLALMRIMESASLFKVGGRNKTWFWGRKILLLSNCDIQSKFATKDEEVASNV